MQTVDMIIREIHMGLWFLVVGYYWYLFIFILFFRWRESKNPFQLAMSLFFLFLAVGRVFYFIGDYFADPRSLPDDVPGLVPYLNPSESSAVLGAWLGIGGLFEWLALAALAATAGFLVFGKRWAELAFSIPAVVIGVALAVLPYESVNQYAGLFAVGYALFIPFLFWYLAYQSGGVLRQSNFILGCGFLVLFAGRLIHAARFALDWAGIMSYSVVGVVSPGLIVIGLILIASGNEWEHIRSH